MKLVRYGLALALTAVALLKLQALVGRSEESVVLPGWASGAVAGGELIVAVLLLKRRWQMGAWCALALGWAFLSGVVYLKLKGIDTAGCGCFGKLQVTRWQHAGIAAGIALSAAGLLAAVENQPVARKTPRVRHAGQ